MSATVETEAHVISSSPMFVMVVRPQTIHSTSLITETELEALREKVRILERQPSVTNLEQELTELRLAVQRLQAPTVDCKRPLNEPVELVEVESNRGKVLLAKRESGLRELDKTSSR